jgi:hypothetical protein
MTPKKRDGDAAFAIDDASLADDLLRGAEAIATELFGDPGGKRKIYHLTSEIAPHLRLPVFRLGAIICARRSTLRAWIAAQENRSRS